MHIHIIQSTNSGVLPHRKQERKKERDEKLNMFFPTESKKERKRGTKSSTCGLAKPPARSQYAMM